MKTFDFDDVDLAILGITVIAGLALGLDRAPDGLLMAAIAAVAGLAKGRKSAATAAKKDELPHPDYIVTDK